MRSGMTVLARVTMPPTEMSLLMSPGFRSRMTLVSSRLNIFTCAGMATASEWVLLILSRTALVHDNILQMWQQQIPSQRAAASC